MNNNLGFSQLTINNPVSITNVQVLREPGINTIFEGEERKIIYTSNVCTLGFRWRFRVFNDDQAIEWAEKRIYLTTDEEDGGDTRHEVFLKGMKVGKAMILFVKDNIKENIFEVMNCYIINVVKKSL